MNFRALFEGGWGNSDTSFEKFDKIAGAFKGKHRGNCARAFAACKQLFCFLYFKGVIVIHNGFTRRALEKGVKTVVFDRGGYLYTGRVKAVADGAREAGLDF